MSRGRFGLVLATLVIGLGAAAFAGVYTLIDGGSDTPPGGDRSGTTTLAPSSPTTPPSTAPGGLATPTFVVVVSSEPDEGAAQASRDELTESGYVSGVLHSDDFTSLAPGFWVAYVGPFTQVADADAAKAALIADGFPAAYSRCVGATEDC